MTTKDDREDLKKQIHLEMAQGRSARLPSLQRALNEAESEHAKPLALQIVPNEPHVDAVIRGSRAALLRLGRQLVVAAQTEWVDQTFVVGFVDADGEEYDIKIEVEDDD
jgi:hypothetical protein